MVQRNSDIKARLTKFGLNSNKYILNCPKVLSDSQLNELKKEEKKKHVKFRKGSKFD